MSALLRTEARLFLREPGTLFFALAFPTLLLLGMGLVIPGMDERVPSDVAVYADLRVIDVFAPVAVVVAIATVALVSLPVFVATYREKGVLRRLATTPMRPQSVMGVHVVINVVALVVAACVAVLAGLLVLGTPLPQDVALAALVFVLGSAAMFSVGLLIAAWAPKGSTASAVGMGLYFPMLFLGGMWTPGPMMPGTMARVAELTPLGAAAQALQVAWFGGGFPTLELVVLVVWSGVLFPVAVRVFRWT